MRTAILLLAVLGACAGDEVDPSNDCTKVLYDNCATEHDCNTGMCRYFMGDDFSVCTQSCDAMNPCPADASGSPATCNGMGICKPAAASTCRLVP